MITIWIISHCLNLRTKTKCLLCHTYIVFLLLSDNFQPSGELENLPDGFLISYTVNRNMTYSHTYQAATIADWWLGITGGGGAWNEGYCTFWGSDAWTNRKSWKLWVLSATQWCMCLVKALTERKQTVGPVAGCSGKWKMHLHMHEAGTFHNFTSYYMRK